MRAIDVDYPAIGSDPLPVVPGIARIDLIADANSATLLALRDVQQLPPRLARWTGT